MLFPLNEPKSMRYIDVDIETNLVHLRVPFVGGQEISTDNTCQSKTELNVFFRMGDGVRELESYKSVLEFHLSLLDENDERRTIKEERLAQINTYLETVISMQNSYITTIDTFLAKPSNLYSIQLRPQMQDPMSVVVNPVFTINRKNSSSGTPLSPLYNKMHDAFPRLTLGKPDPSMQLITSTLSALPQDASFEDIQRVLNEQCQALFDIPVDFQSYINRTDHRTTEKQTVDKAYIDALMGFGDDTTPEEYINALLGCCASSLWVTLEGSPFYLGTYSAAEEQAECLSMMTQFYLGVLNVHCRAQGISNKNFGEILDNSSTLSQALVESISQALTSGDDVESAVISFFNAHKVAFSLSENLGPNDKNAIQNKFKISYKTVTATKENPYMDDFMILDRKASGEKDIFFTQNGLICTDFANIAPPGPHQDYFTEIRQNAATHANALNSQEEPAITIDIEPEALMDKLSNIQWGKVPREMIDACRTFPAFLNRQFSDDVAKGNQDEAEAMLRAPEDKQAMLRMPTKLTDYSGRTFNCTAYEYAYWAKDTRMCRMLESHMDDATKTYLLDKVEEMEQVGLAYRQHGVDYQNPHYDNSFVLKDLSANEFSQIKKMLGANNNKIQEATVDNYRTLAFSATEYEQLKQAVEKHKQYRATSFFYTSPANAIANKLTFDFNSLITALDKYTTKFVRHDSHQQGIAWLEVGMAQRDVPAHIAQEYCDEDGDFGPQSEFNEPDLSRASIFNFSRNQDWFPPAASSAGLGVDFAVIRGRMNTEAEGGVWRGMAGGVRPGAASNLKAVRRLDEVRTADLTRSRDILSEAVPNQRLGLSSLRGFSS